MLTHCIPGSFISGYRQCTDTLYDNSLTIGSGGSLWLVTIVAIFAMLVYKNKVLTFSLSLKCHGKYFVRFVN